MKNQTCQHCGQQIQTTSLSVNETELLLDFPGAEGELEKFIDYWTEKSPNGKKMRWEKEKTFDISRRFKRWMKNAKDWNKGTSNKVLTFKI